MNPPRIQVLGEFLVAMLKAQGDTLARLGEFWGETRALDLLEERDESHDSDVYSARLHAELSLAAKRALRADPATYAALQAVVMESGLSEPLAFHLWAYPAYRALMESNLPLSLPIAGPDEPDGTQPLGVHLIEETVEWAKVWLDSLRLPIAMQPQVRITFDAVWLRFRNQILRGLGRNPFQAL